MGPCGCEERGGGRGSGRGHCCGCRLPSAGRVLKGGLCGAAAQGGLETEEEVETLKAFLAEVQAAVAEEPSA